MPPNVSDNLAASPDEIRYVNFLQVGRTEREVFLEFGQYHDGDSQPRISIRLATHPDYAREFLHVLAAALANDHPNPAKQ